MTAYYIATDGSSNNNGSFGAPWADISDINGNVSPGDTVYMRGGIYNNHDRDPVAVGDINGTITIQRYKNEVPRIRAYEVVTGWSLVSGNIYSASVNMFDASIPGFGCWYDGEMLGDAASEVGLAVNKYYYDEGTQTLYVNVGEDPSNGEVWASQVSVVRFSSNGRLTFRGIVLEYGLKAAGRISQYGDEAMGDGVTFEGCYIRKIHQNAFQPLEQSWSFLWSCFEDLGPTNGTTNYAYTFYTGSDIKSSTWRGNIIRNQRTGYWWHIYPDSVHSPAHTIEDNLCYGVTWGAFIIADDTGGHTIKNNAFVGETYTNGYPPPFFGMVLRSSGNVVEGNRFANMGAWMLEDGSTDRTNTLRNNKVWNCGYYSDDNHAGTSHINTRWTLTRELNFLQFAHNGSSVGSTGANWINERDSWRDNYATWISWNELGEPEPTWSSLLTEWLRRYPQHGYFLLNGEQGRGDNAFRNLYKDHHTG